jgi:phosphotransferase system enzyme I (PtsI)
LLASVVAQLEGHGVRGLIVEKGGLTAHATILARALGISMLVHVPEATNRIRAGDLLIVDALAGRIFTNPKPEILRKYDQLEADLQIHQSALKGLIGLPAVKHSETVECCHAEVKTGWGVRWLPFGSPGLCRAQGAVLQNS